MTYEPKIYKNDYESDDEEPPLLADYKKNYDSDGE